MLVAAGGPLQPGGQEATSSQLQGQGLLFSGLRVRMSIASGIAETCHTKAQVGEATARACELWRQA